MIQGSPEWFAARSGCVTASRIGDIMARTQRGAFTAARGHYLKEKIAERITGKPRDIRRVKSLDDRRDLEPDARAAYEFYTDSIVETVGFIEHPRIPHAGCSPDGRVNPKGGIEIKALDAEQHLELITADAINPDYLWQCHFNIACCDADWWDLTAFNPDMPEELKLFVKRIERDDSLIATIETNVIEFLAEVDQKVAQVRGLMQGKTPLEVALSSSLESLQVN